MITVRFPFMFCRGKEYANAARAYMDSTFLSSFLISLNLASKLLMIAEEKLSPRHWAMDIFRGAL